MSESPTAADQWLKIAQTVAIVAGMLGSVWTYNVGRQHEASVRYDREEEQRETKKKEAEALRIQVLQPFLKLRQERYEEVSKVVAKLANHPRESDEFKNAYSRFKELYVVELSMVESLEVEAAMKRFAIALRDASETPEEITQFDRVQKAAFDLSHDLRNSLCNDYGWQIEKTESGNPILLNPEIK
ncbi:MAG: hypothetical protein WCI02_02795 [Planctomycetota bacterium]